LLHLVGFSTITTTELVLLVSVSGHAVLLRVERNSYLHSVSNM